VNTAIEQAFIETYSTHHPQVLLSALAPQQVAEVDAQVSNSNHRESRIAALRTPAFSELVNGLCHQLWDQLSQYGSGNAFSLLDEQDLEQRRDERILSIRVCQWDWSPPSNSVRACFHHNM